MGLTRLIIIAGEIAARDGLGAEDGSTYSTTGRPSELPAELSGTPFDGGMDDVRGASGDGGEDESAGMATGLIVSSASSCEAGGIGKTEDPDDCGPLGSSSVTAPWSELVDGLVGVTMAGAVRVVP
jgi:hypothetical protein